MHGFMHVPCRFRVCGCYHDIASGTQTKTESLPRINVKAHTTIFSTASRTELVQTFVNPSQTENIPECRYVFPLYDGVSIVQFSCQVGSRTIKGVVKEKAEAKQEFEKAVSQGETAGLLEQGPTTDVFVTSLGNIPAGERLQVKITFIGELKHDLALQGIRFTIPTSISPRYGFGAPSGGIDSSSAEGICITVDINMPSECPIEEVRSPSHPIAVSLGQTSVQSNSPPNLSNASATLSLGETFLDKDFVLEIRHEDSGKPRAFLETHPDVNGQRALMTTLVPQEESLQGEIPEIIIIADQSGSMSGGRTKTLVTALQILLKSLPVGVKFNICAFGSSNSFLWQNSHTYDEKALTEAIRFVQCFHGHLGGTETMFAVQRSIQSRDPTKNLSLILATDGDIWHQEDFFSYLDEQLARSEKLIRVFPLGIGNAVSSGLIEGVARAGKGFASTVAEGEQLDTKVIRMLKGAMTPDSGNYTLEIQYHEDNDEDEYDLVERVTDSLRIMMVDEAGSSGGFSSSAMVIDEEKLPTDKSKTAAVVTPKLLQAPQVIPPLYPLSKATIYILLSPKTSRATPKTVILRNNAANNPFEMSIPVEVIDKPATLIHSLAAKHAILELEEGRGWLSHAKDGEDRLIMNTYSSGEYENMVKAEAVRLGVQYQITGKYTSSVAVESNSTAEHTETPTEKEITLAPPSSSPVPKVLDRSNLRELAAFNHADPSSSCPPPASNMLRRSDLRELSAVNGNLVSSSRPPPPPTAFGAPGVSENRAGFASVPWLRGGMSSGRGSSRGGRGGGSMLGAPSGGHQLSQLSQFASGGGGSFGAPTGPLQLSPSDPRKGTFWDPSLPANQGFTPVPPGGMLFGGNSSGGSQSSPSAPGGASLFGAPSGSIPSGGLFGSNQSTPSASGGGERFGAPLAAPQSMFGHGPSQPTPSNWQGFTSFGLGPSQAAPSSVFGHVPSQSTPAGYQGFTSFGRGPSPATPRNYQGFEALGGGSVEDECPAASKDMIDYSDEDQDMGFGSDMEEKWAMNKDSEIEGDGKAKVGSEQLQNLIALQSFAGSWKYEKKLLAACDISGFPKQPKGLDSKVWATIIALAFLRWKLNAQREVWELVARKAREWLKAQGVDLDRSEGMKLSDQAKKLVLGA